MVKIFATTLSILVLTIASVRAQGIVVANYPKINEVPDINSPEVKAWLKEIDLTGAPTTALLKAPKGSPPDCKDAAPDSCTWTCTACAEDDITSCALPNTWGLTFDDGPSTATPTLLDFLKTNKLSASFFLIGSNVIQYPETVKRELAEGHHLASHTWSHAALTTLSNEQIVAEMKWTEKAVLEATGLRLKYMRPPYGDINNRVRFVLRKLGYIPVDWTGDAYDTNDWRIGQNFTEANAVSTFSKSLDAYVASPKTSGFYCLEHDVSATTVSAAQKLVPLGISRKINFAAVPACQNDASPYQAGGTTPIPTTNGTTGPNKATGTSHPTGTATSQPNVVDNNKKSGAAQISASGIVSALAVVVGAVFA